MTTVAFASIVVTYRCNARCGMCHTWRRPPEAEKEIGVGVYRKLPRMRTVNVTGGEPFLRDDLDEIVAVLKKKARRVVISSNGYLTDRITDLFKRHHDIGIRVSLEGLPKANDELRGLKDGFDHAMRSLLELDRMGVEDIGFGITVSDRNATDLLALYQLSKLMGVEFATAAVHNGFYFHKYDNTIRRPDIAVREFSKLVAGMLRSRRVKDWFRAYFNYGLMNYIEGRPRLLPCEMGIDSCFVDPYGDMYPCNVLKEAMGNLEQQSFEEIWTSQRANAVRRKVRACQKHCWMIGSVSQQMEKNMLSVCSWLLKNKCGAWGRGAFVE